MQETKDGIEKRIKKIEETIMRLEQTYSGEPVRINTTDLMDSIAGKGNYNRYYLVRTGIIFSRRGWRARRLKGHQRRVYEYSLYLPKAEAGMREDYWP